MNRIATSLLVLALAGISAPPSLAANAQQPSTTFHRGTGRTGLLPIRLLAKGGVAIGMTKQQVLQSLGKPTRKQSENVWYYAQAGDGPLTIYFKGNKVSGFGEQG